MEIVNSIKFVDSVVPQSSMDKFEAWHKLKFKLMFVGDDWKGTEKWNHLEREFFKLSVRRLFAGSRTLARRLFNQI